MKKLLTIIAVLIMCASCTVMSGQHKLYSGLTEPTKLEDIPFLKITNMSFLEAGWACAERAGYLGWLHPAIIQFYGCADVRILNGKVVYCDVIYSSEWALEHELNHCKGYDD